MRGSPSFAWICSILFLLLFAMPARSEEKQPKPSDDTNVSTARVQKLFESMREGKYDDLKFPELKRSDIPALLEMGKSMRVLKTFPRNDVSSQYEANCREGMVALWLVEGLRKGSRFPSLNALCLPEGPIAGKWAEASEKNHSQILKAYQAWWQRAQSLSAEEAKKIDPLAGTRLHWH